MKHAKKHRRLTLALQSIFALILAVLLSGTAWSRDDNPKNGPPEGSSLQLLPFQPTAATDTTITFRADSGGNLDSYICGINSTISFAINVTGLEDAIIKSAKLALAVYDIDYICDETYGACERDTVSFNGNLLATPVTYLTGADNQWSSVTFDVDPVWINKSDGNAVNTIVITIDTLGSDRWCMECDWGELRLEVEKGPEIKEIKITPAAAPMTENDVEIEAVVEEVAGYEVDNVIFLLTDVVKGTIDQLKLVDKSSAPYSFTFKPAAGTHGKKNIAAFLAYKKTTTQKFGYDDEEKDFKLFFQRDRLTDPAVATSVPNWYKYWQIDGAVLGFVPAIAYDPVCSAGSTCYGSYNRNTGIISFGPGASGTHYRRAIALATHFGNESFGGPTVKGIDCASEVIAHEGQHKTVKENWDSGVFAIPDSDKDTDNTCFYTHPTAGWTRYCDDRLPDSYEKDTSFTSDNNTDTYNLAAKKSGVYKTYGDQEYLCMRTGNGGRGTPEKDWANPGKQVPAAAAAAEPAPVKAVPLTQFRNPALQGIQGFTGSYTDTGVDTNANTYYDYLKITAALNIDIADLYTVYGVLRSAGGDFICSATQDYDLAAGAYNAELNFDGMLIYHSNTNGPYNLSVQLMNPFGDEVESWDSIYQTAAYTYTEFEGAQAVFTGACSDAAADTDADGVYDTLTVTVGLSSSLAGTYKISGYLKDSDGKSFAFASATASLGTGAATVPLVFESLPIGLNGKNGPYTLSRLAIHDSADKLLTQVNEACQTAAYSSSSFKAAQAELSGAYSDQGIDTDANSLFNTLRIIASITVSQAGTYNLSGTLYDSNNSIIQSASAQATLDTGSQTINLDFDGKLINKNLVDGPYKLNMVMLYNNGALIDLVENAYTSTAYSYTDFEAQPVALTGNYRDAATDENSDEVADYLDIWVEVVAQSNCTVALNARILDSLNHEIAWGSNTASLTAKTPQEILLRYDAQTIFDNQVNGPYYLSDVYVYNMSNTDQNDSDMNAYVTQSSWNFMTTTTTTAPVTTTTTTARCPAKQVLGEENPQLDTLRTFRDDSLAGSAIGRTMISLYYRNADSINAVLERSPALRAMARRLLETAAVLAGKQKE